MNTLFLAICSMSVLSLGAGESIQLEDSGSASLSDVTAVTFSANIATAIQIDAPDKPSAVDGVRYTITNETQPKAVQLSLRVQDKHNGVGFIVSIPLVSGDRLFDISVLNDTALYVRIGSEKEGVWRCVLVDVPGRKLIYVKNYVDGENPPVIVHNKTATVPDAPSVPSSPSPGK